MKHLLTATTLRSRPPNAELRARRSGLTLVELLLAVAGTALVATALASLLFAVASGTDSDRDLRSLVSKQHLISARISAAIRSSRMVLEEGDDYFVLWIADHNDNSAPELSEIRLIEHDTNNDLIISYKAPSDLDAGDDAQYGLSDDFAAITDAIKGGATFPGTLWSTQVTGWSTGLNNADEQLATLVSFQMTIKSGTLEETTIGAAGLQSD